MSAAGTSTYIHSLNYLEEAVGRELLRSAVTEHALCLDKAVERRRPFASRPCLYEKAHSLPFPCRSVGSYDYYADVMFETGTNLSYRIGRPCTY